MSRFPCLEEHDLLHDGLFYRQSEWAPLYEGDCHYWSCTGIWYHPDGDPADPWASDEAILNVTLHRDTNDPEVVNYTGWDEWYVERS